MSRKRKQKADATPVQAAEAPKIQQLFMSADLFCATWNSKATLREVSEALGMAASTCALYADRLRKDGRTLKEFLRGRPRRFKM